MGRYPHTGEGRCLWSIWVPAGRPEPVRGPARGRPRGPDGHHWEFAPVWTIGRMCGYATAARNALGSMFYVYLLASKPYGTLYVGTTSDLARRVWEHKNRVVSGFTKRYGIDRLVWFEVHDLAETALRREKQIKEWKRDSKINLIEQKPTLDRSLSALDDLIADCLMIL